MTAVLITGANGFVGKHLVSLLSGKEYNLRLGLREAGDSGVFDEKLEIINFDLGNTDNDYGKLLHDVDVVVHLAGIAHRKSVSDADYARINTAATARLVTESVKRGIKRFIFLSTIKVHGESTALLNDRYHGITEDTATLPQDGYSKSKLDAELAIIKACSGSDTEYVILRPPLIYGPGVKANFLKLLQLVSSRLPLPLSNIKNKRSLIYVENLCDLVRICIDSPAAANQVFVVKDYDDSTPGLITNISRAFGRGPWLFPLPSGVLGLVGKMIRQDAAINRLTESLLVDNSKSIRDLHWKPPVDTDAGIRKTVAWFIDSKQAKT